MPAIKGASFGYALLALLVGLLAFVGMIYVPTYINTSLVQSGYSPVLPTIPQNFYTTATAGGIAFILMFVLLMMASRGQKIQIPSE